MTPEQLKAGQFLTKRIHNNKQTIELLDIALKDSEDGGCYISITNAVGMRRGSLSSLRGNHRDKQKVHDVIKGIRYYLVNKIHTDSVNLGEL